MKKNAMPGVCEKSEYKNALSVKRVFRYDHKEEIYLDSKCYKFGVDLEI